MATQKLKEAEKPHTFPSPTHIDVNYNEERENKKHYFRKDPTKLKLGFKKMIS